MAPFPLAHRVLLESASAARVGLLINETDFCQHHVLHNPWKNVALENILLYLTSSKFSNLSEQNYPELSKIVCYDGFWPYLQN